MTPSADDAGVIDMDQLILSSVRLDRNPMRSNLATRLARRTSPSRCEEAPGGGFRLLLGA